MLNEFEENLLISIFSLTMMNLMTLRRWKIAFEEFFASIFGLRFYLGEKLGGKKDLP